MNKIIKKYTTIVILTGVLSLSGCNNNSSIGTTEKINNDINKTSEKINDNSTPVSKDIFAMDTYMTLTAYGEKGENAVEKGTDEIERLDNMFSTGENKSEISELNTNKSKKVSMDVIYLIKESKNLYKTTDEKFDIGIYPIMKLWGFTDKNFKVPDKKLIDEQLKNLDVNKIAVDEKENIVTIPKNMEIDLGGIVKGYASNQVMNIFKENGVTSGIVSLGGNVQTLGTKPDGSLWKIAIQDPKDSDSYMGVLSIANKAVITSGAYERNFEKDGKIYHHIIDPKTGYPANNGLISVTIISENGTIGDGLSTSLYIMGKEKAINYWKEYGKEQNFEIVIEDEDENVYVSEGISNNFASDKKISVIK